MAKRPSIPTLAGDILDLRARLIAREQRIESEVYAILQSMLDEWEREVRRILGGGYRGTVESAVAGRRAVLLGSLRKITEREVQAVLGILGSEVAGVYRDNVYRVASALSGMRAASMTSSSVSFAAIDTPAIKAALARKIPAISELRAIAAIPARVESLMRKDLARAIADGYRVDQLVSQWKNRVGAGATVPQVRALARTAVMTASNNAHLDTYRKNRALVPRVRWEATFDRRTCMRCGSLHGREFTLADAPPIPAHLNCILPGNLVLRASVLAAAKSLYRGRVVEVRTEGGCRISVTEKHPVLTSRGWIRASEVRRGDDLVNHPGSERESSGVDPHDHNVPTAIEEVFRSLEESVGVGSARVPLSPEDLHGDADGVEGEVHVVWADGGVPGVGHTSGREHFRDRFLDRAAMIEGTEPLPSGRDLDAMLERLRLSAYRVMGGLGESESLGLGRLRHACEHCGGPVSRNYSVGDQSASDNAPIAPEEFRDRLLALPCGVSLDCVVDVDHSSYSGHVYDLQTVSGTINCGGVIIHNCRCVLLPVFADPSLNSAVHGIGAYQSPTGGTYFRNKDRDFEKFLRSRTPDFRADFFPSELKRKAFESGRLSLADMISRDGSIKTDAEVLRLLRRRP